MSAIIWWLEHSLVLPFLGIGMRIDLFQSFGHCWVFQICWHIECNILIASSFRVLNSSTGIPLHPLALLTAVLPKAHLTSHSRMSGSRSSMYYLKDMKLYIFLLLQIMLLCTMPLIHVYTYFSQLSFVTSWMWFISNYLKKYSKTEINFSHTY